MHSESAVKIANKRRQWGSEKRTLPLSMLHDKPTVWTMALSRLAIFFTIGFWLIYIFSIIIRQLFDGGATYNFTMEAFFYAFVVSILTFSSLMYLVARHGALQRFAKHVRVPRAILDSFFAKNKPGITVLVPSYNEEPAVIRKTLLSAALQEYPNKRVVLLLDNNPKPTNPEDIDRLAKARNIEKDITNFLSVPYKHATEALKRFKKVKTNKAISVSEIKILAENYKWTANWLNEKAEAEVIEDHVDVFFADQVLRELAKDLNLMSDALLVSAKENGKISYDRAYQLYERLVWIFKAEVTSFERKKYASLSHEANKAMNLNSYIGIMGGNFRQENTPEGIVLIPSNSKSKKNLSIPDSEFLLTLDADSILLREYCLRLVYFMKQPDHERVAVAQTPYSSFRGAFSRIERLAAATTDVQHILHQGLTFYDATFWVGANAVIRKSALEDIAESEWVGGFEVKRYIQDRTVIEDTESSIDIKLHGWKLMNYPERLSYSATPPDFGSLVVQRRRWANGGLIILPKLFSNKSEKKNLIEVLLRLNYLASIAWATFGLIFLLAYPYDGRLLSPLVLLAAIPYFLTLSFDLKYCGYNYSDIFRIYGFNLIMLPVNLAGVIKSIEQSLTGKKIPFARTPKVKDRTATEALFVIVPLFIVVFSVFTAYRNILISNWGNAVFAAFNALAASWAILAYIGLGNVIVDTWLGFVNWLYVEDKPKEDKKAMEKNPQIDWKAVLYSGDAKGAVPQATLYEKI